ncbi:MAG: MOSC domain-containing protein [Gemmataceae bacterium]|nr:MOSC domain-containing protein [Gemmataceae bacterium]
MSTPLSGYVVNVSRSSTHSLAKYNEASIRLIAGFGVEGDAHAGEKVRHRYHVRKNPDRPNLCQVHLIHAELFDELSDFELQPGEMGENITTRGIALMDLPEGTLLRIGPDALIRLTGRRTPCSQLEQVRPGLRAATTERVAGKAVFKAGVMGVVVEGGQVKPNDPILIELPAPPHAALKPV